MRLTMGQKEGQSQCPEVFLQATLPHLGPPEVWGLLRNVRNEIMPGAAISGSLPLQILSGPMGLLPASQQPLPE